MKVQGLAIERSRGFPFLPSAHGAPPDVYLGHFGRRNFLSPIIFLPQPPNETPIRFVLYGRRLLTLTRRDASGGCQTRRTAIQTPNGVAARHSRWRRLRLRAGSCAKFCRWRRR